jgi:hypothetical protein
MVQQEGSVFRSFFADFCNKSGPAASLSLKRADISGIILFLKPGEQMGANIMGHKSYLVLIAAFLLPAAGYSDIYNNSFEQSEPNSSLNFETPTGWASVNYAAVTKQFWPTPLRGSAQNWLIDMNEGLLPAHGKRFVALSTGDVTGPNDIWGASIAQAVTVSAGQKISGFYFFGTCDWGGTYNDYGEILLDPGADGQLMPIILAYADANEVGKYSSQEGWQYFEHVFTEQESGAYVLWALVADVGDPSYNSYLAVDGLALCSAPPAFGDLNLDCHVDFKDFSYLAGDWLADCNDPNYLADPNNNCGFDTDIDDSNVVDANDLKLMTDSWLQGQ